MDVVYFVRQDWINEELRYSLRSLKNIKYNKVYIVGYRPYYLQNIVFIPFFDKGRKWKNTSEKLFIIANNKDISKDFILMSDDIYIIKKLKEIKYYKIWKLSDYINNIKIKTSEHYKTIKATYDIYSDWECFDTHTPIIFNKNKLKKLYKKYPLWLRGSKRTLYCIENKIKGEFIKAPRCTEYKTNLNKKLKDCKCYEWLKVLKNQKIISSSIDFNKNFEFKEFLKTLFPKKCFFEK
jgi:hypothetical protein